MVTFPGVKQVADVLIGVIKGRARVMGVGGVFYENGKVLTDIILRDEKGRILVPGDDGSVEIPFDWRNQRIGVYLSSDGRLVKYAWIPNRLNGPHRIVVTYADCVANNLTDVAAKWSRT
ncbi:MAG: hypothetical protein ACYTEL_17080 [Planctomycetota bacterium]|jgi:hypothetical protein